MCVGAEAGLTNVARHGCARSVLHVYASRSLNFGTARQGRGCLLPAAGPQRARQAKGDTTSVSERSRL